MSANIVICPHCNCLATVIDMTPAPRFAWCDSCRALLLPKGPDPAVPAGKPPRKKSPSRSRSTTSTPKTPKPKES